MYKIFVVDDELWFREGIKGSIRWSDYDAEIVGEASDGEEALELIEKLRPDIVFADIRMPVMNGLELASIVMEKYPETKVIIVSGHEEFEYAQKAVNIGVSCYLTKPVDVDQLINVVGKAQDEIRQGREESVIRNKIENQLKESLPLLREKFLNNLVNGEIRNISEIEKKLEFLNIPLKLEKYILFIIDIERDNPVFSDQQEKDRHLSRLAVLNILEEILKEEKGIVVFNGQNDNILGIAPYHKQVSAAFSHIQIARLFERFRTLVYKNHKLSVTIGVSRLNDRWDRVDEAYNEAMDAVKYKLFLGRNQVIFFQDISINVNRDNRYSFIGREELMDAIKLGNKDKAKSILDNNFSELLRNTSLEYDYIQEMYLGLLGEILNYIHGIDASSKAIFHGNPFRELLNLSTLEDINLWFTDTCNKVIQLILNLRQQQNQNVIEQVTKYICDNYSKDISLNSAAEYVFLSPAYLSRLFKKETGKSFIQYIMEIRVKKAKELLRTTDKKINEIAKEIGYTDMGYFAKMFKAIEGITPAQYKEKA